MIRHTEETKKLMQRSLDREFAVLKSYNKMVSIRHLPEAERNQIRKSIKAVQELESALEKKGSLLDSDPSVANWLSKPTDFAHRVDPSSEYGKQGITFDDERASKGYEIRSASQTKTYRDLYGSNPENVFEWRDKNSNFFSALFSGRYHPELIKRALVENLPSDGGFIVPTYYTEKIHNVSLESEIVMPKATVAPMKSNTMEIPATEIGDHSSSLFGGFTASYKPEAGTLTEANPKLRNMELNAKKLTGFLRFSNELNLDSPSGIEQLLQICGSGLAWYRDKSFLKGSGAGEPLGILNASCTLVQPKESGQAANTIMYENLTGMLGKLYAGSFKNSVWICHQTCIPELLELSIAIGTGGSAIPVMKETNGSFSILTRPIIFTEKTETCGNQGDILLADLSQYVIGLNSIMRMDLSKHLYFQTDEMAARLIERHDGQPLWDEALTLEDGSSQVSPFVVLAER